MLGRRPNRSGTDVKKAGKKRKWQESDDDDDEDKSITAEDLDQWRRTMHEEERQERERQEKIKREQLEHAKLEEELRRKQQEDMERRQRERDAEDSAAESDDDSQSESHTAPLRTRIKSGFSDAPPPVLIPTGGTIHETDRMPHTMAGLLDVPAHTQIHEEGAAPEGAGAQDVTTANFQIAASKVTDVLGVRGTNIRAVKQLSGIQKVTIVDRSEELVASGSAVVSVTGTAQQIDRARALILSICAGDQLCVGNATETLNIDDILVPRIIGPKGQTITQMKDQSGAYISVRKGPDGVQQQVVMTGPPEAVVVARQLVVNFLMEQAAGTAASSTVAGAFNGAADGCHQFQHCAHMSNSTLTLTAPLVPPVPPAPPAPPAAPIPQVPLPPPPPAPRAPQPTLKQTSHLVRPATPAPPPPVHPYQQSHAVGLLSAQVDLQAQLQMQQFLAAQHLHGFQH